jgi:molybdate transport system ATP-binding protein
MAGPVIEIDLAHDFPGFALRVAFAAPSGITALFGPSGSGKSSVALALAGLRRPDRALIRLGGRVLQDETTFLPPQARRIGVVFQDHRLFPHLTVRQNLGYARRFGQARGGADLGEVAELLGIAPLLGRGTADLSGGERARVAIGRALLSDPAALILDEPFAALDAARRAEILPYLENLRDRFALPMLLISHSLGEVARLASTLVVVQEGQVVARGKAETLFSDPRLVPIFGSGEAGALIAGRVGARAADGLTEVETAGGPVFLPGALPAQGRAIRLRIRAQDVMLAVGPVSGISALNLLEAVVESLIPEGEAGVIVVLRLREERLLARVTRRSAEALGLAPGTRVRAILKTVALAGV